MNPTVFAMVGGGWRAEFFLRVAKALPERFQVGGMLVRNAEKGAAIEATWGVRTYRTLDDLLRGCKPAFVVVSVPRDAVLGMVRELVSRNVPALVETPPAPDRPEDLATIFQAVGRTGRVQVAEQYAFQPLHAARLTVAHSGKLGAVTHAQVSVAHDYHGLSLVRKFLGVMYEDASIQARAFTSPIIAGPGRNGPPARESVSNSRQVIAQLDFGGKLGIYDFTGDQYFSWVRSPRVLVRGERGEINNRELRYLVDFRTPITTEFRREEAGQDGNLEGLYLKGILAGSEWVYRNPFVPARLTDDEIAVATCMQRMGEYAGGGPEFYSVAEACQDTYLGALVQRAVTSGQPVKSERQPWAG
ncbi:MAG: oxidoreductase [Lentisphaerae bacterium RIFOXYB12_FULL_65_16]|nr:MAG: oxidoreductase [Lentisphaerae bacterium RIFOXYA12_64_32]OGV92159.1 MAG: oxidoreductase [Lentisphaerae bacterium RIFOXYB12_FULL_65_16]